MTQQGVSRHDMTITTAQLRAWLPQACWVGGDDWVVHGVQTDSRCVRSGDLLVALRGERFDAHTFLPQARAAGAVAALCEVGHLQPMGWQGLEVPDSRAALGQLAASWRGQFALPLIAVTGSNGKTTVTQMLAQILHAAWGDAALATQGNFNNDIGVPLTLLRLRAQHRMAVLELGMNHPGEIAGLARMAAPTVALVNNAQREHQEYMGSVDAVAEENGQVIAALPADGIAVFPADSPYATLWRTLAGPRQCLCFAAPPAAGAAPAAALSAGAVADGGADGADAANTADAAHVADTADTAAGPVAAQVYIRTMRWQQNSWALEVQTPAGLLACALHMAGRHNIHNALAAISCALAAGVALPAIAQGLSAFRPVQGRSRMVPLSWQGRDLVLVDDSYNANPDSVLAAIDLLADLPAPQVLVLGDMAEVGEHGASFHAEVGAYARQRGIAHLLAIGELAQYAADALDGGRHCGDTPDAMPALLAALPPVLAQAGSVLVKGSRRMRMERVVEALVHPPDP